MPIETWMTVVACAAAAVATVTALLAIRTLRQLRREMRRAGGLDMPSPSGSGYSTSGEGAEEEETVSAEVVYAPTPLAQTRQVLPHERAVVTQEGTVIVLPSEQQVVAATMGRPLVRGAVLSHGLMHALRPESRDRIRGIVRREFRRRRKIRRRAARQAARAASMSPEVTSWPGTPTTPEQEGTR